MRTKDIVVGSVAVCNEDPTFSSRRQIAYAEKVRVLEINVAKTYWAKGGYNGGGGRREITTGVRVEVIANANGVPADGETKVVRPDQLASWDVEGIAFELEVERRIRNREVAADRAARIAAAVAQINAAIDPSATDEIVADNATVPKLSIEQLEAIAAVCALVAVPVAG